MVPAPAAGNANRYLRSDATWQKLYTSTGSSTDGTMTRTAITNALNGKLSTSSAGYIKSLSISGRTITYTKGDNSTGTLTTQDTNTTYSTFKAATSSAAGGTGLVPAPTAGAQSKFLRADATWQTPTNTTYGTFKAATSSAAGGSGLVPAPAAGAQSKYLRADATWQTPPNTTYSTGTASTLGLTKLYTSTGTSTDGTMTRAAITTALDGKLGKTATAAAATKLATARKINGVAFNGTADITIYANPNATQLTNQNLNDTRTYGEYYAGGSNTVTNTPSSGVDPFWLKVFRSASGYTTQMLYDPSADKLYTRTYQSGTWTGWVSYYSSKNPQTTISGNAASATKLATARTISLGGDCSGSASFNGTANITITATVKDDSHNHTIANVDNLQSTLDSITSRLTAVETKASTALTNANSAKTVTDKYKTLLNIIGNNQ